MFCTNCGNKLAEDAKFCSFCGARVAGPEEQKIRTVADLGFDGSKETEPVPENPFAVPEEPVIKIPRESMPFDWSNVVDEPHKKEVKEIKSPWGATETIDEKELYAEMTPSTDRSRTMSFIDVLKAEKEEKEKAAADRAIEYTDVLKIGPDLKAFDEPPQLHYAPLFEDLDEPVKTPFDRPAAEETKPAVEDEPRFETTRDTIADFDDAVKGFEKVAGIAKDEPVFEPAAETKPSVGNSKFELPDFLKKDAVPAAEAERASEVKDRDREEPVYEPKAYSGPAYEEPTYREPVYEEPVAVKPELKETAFDEPVFEEPKYDEGGLSEEPEDSDSLNIVSGGDDVESIYLDMKLGASGDSDPVQAHAPASEPSVPGWSEKPAPAEEPAGIEMIDEEALFAEMSESRPKKTGMTIAAPADKESEIEELKKRLSELMGTEERNDVPDYEAMTLEEAEKPDFSFKTIKTEKLADLYEGPNIIEEPEPEPEEPESFSFEPIVTPSVDELFEGPTHASHAAPQTPAGAAYVQAAEEKHAAPAARAEAVSMPAAPAAGPAAEPVNIGAAATAPAAAETPVVRFEAEPVTAPAAAPATEKHAVPAAQAEPVSKPAAPAAASAAEPVNIGAAATAPASAEAPVVRLEAEHVTAPAAQAEPISMPAASAASAGTAYVQAPQEKHAAPAAQAEPVSMPTAPAASAGTAYVQAAEEKHAAPAAQAEPVSMPAAPAAASAAEPVNIGAAATAPAAAETPVVRLEAEPAPAPAAEKHAAPAAQAEPVSIAAAPAAASAAEPVNIQAAAPSPAAAETPVVRLEAEPVAAPAADKHAALDAQAEPVSIAAAPAASVGEISVQATADKHAAPVVEIPAAAGGTAPAPVGEEKSSDALSLEELEKNLFGEVPDEETEAEETKKIDKFYTLYRKNEEFQKLLDEEYGKLKGEDRGPQAAPKADAAVVEKKTIYRPVEDETIYMPKELVEEKAKLEAERRGEIKLEASPASEAAAPTFGLAPEAAADSSKPLVEVEAGETAGKKKDKKAARAAAKAEKARKKEEKKLAKAGAAVSGAEAADELEYEEVDSGSRFLTVLAVIIAIILVILLAVILVLQFAPNSGAAYWITNLIENITVGISLVDPGDGQFLL